MQKLLYVFFLIIFFVPYLAKNEGVVIRQLAWLPEIFSAFIACYVLFYGIKQKRFILRPIYLVCFSALLVHILGGITLNLVEPGTLFAGLRTYFKYIPLFFLPAVHNFSDTEIKNQLKFILFLAILQVPFAVYQRLLGEKAQVLTGDFVVGTLQVSGMLTIFVTSTIALLLGFYLKKKISFRFFAITALIVFIPSTLNETKITLFLLPLALIVPVAFIQNKSERIKKLTVMVMAGTIMIGGVFIPIYDHFQTKRWGYGIIDFFMMEDRVRDYLAPSTLGDKSHKMGRIDSVLLPIQEFSDTPLRMMWGVGIGNASQSFLTRFSGEYSEYAEHMRGVITQLLWEIGIGGVILMLWFLALIFRDTLRLRADTSTYGAIAQGWIGVLFIIFLCLIYNNFLHNNVIGFLFWYICGHIAARQYMLELEHKQKYSPKAGDLQIGGVHLAYTSGVGHIKPSLPPKTNLSANLKPINHNRIITCVRRKR